MLSFYLQKILPCCATSLVTDFNLYEFSCRNKGILFVAIDHNRPLSDQGPFDIVLHKVMISSCEFPRRLSQIICVLLVTRW